MFLDMARVVNCVVSRFRVHKCAKSFALGCNALALLSACGQANVTESDLVTNRSALSSGDGAILGFEQTNYWAVTNGSATLATSTSHVEGANSLAVSNVGYVELTSQPLSSLAVNDGSVSVDILLPGNQPNPYWYGQVQLYVDCPSVSVNNQYIDARELTGLPLAAFQRLNFTLPSDLTSTMATPHNDLRFKIVLNVPQNSATYLLDRLHLNAKDDGGTTGGGADPGEGGAIQVSVALPKDMTPKDTLLAASGDLVLADRVNAISSGETTIVNTGNGETNIGVDAQVGNVWSAVAIELRDRGHATGYATSRSTVTLDTDAAVDGQVTQNMTVEPYVTFSWSTMPPATNLGQRDVEPDQSMTLEPGRFGAVSVQPRATLSLHSGTYFMDSLTVEPQSHLDIDETSGPVTIYVMNNLIYRGTSAARDGDLNNYMVVVLGSDPLAIDSAFDGTLLAPNGERIHEV